MSVKSFSCSCGNTDPKKAKEYDGMLGYEAIVCKVCGRYYDLDENGVGRSNEADEWSGSFVGLKVKIKIKNVNITSQKEIK